MRAVAFEVPGEPRGKGRPIVTKNGTFTPTRTVEYENFVRMCYIEQCTNQYLDGPISAEITAYMQIPKSASKKKRAAMAAGEILPEKKPDIDNIAKSILDSLNGIAYKDDSSVTALTVRKLYSEIPRVEVTLYCRDDVDQ